MGPYNYQKSTLYRKAFRIAKEQYQLLVGF